MATQTAQRAAVIAAAVLLAFGVLAAWAVSARAALPDGRAYEMASPQAKNGVDVISQSSKTFATADGNGVAFAALGGFGSVRGSSVDVQYVSRRDGSGSTGWATRAVNPVGGAPTIIALFSNNLPTFAWLSPDLTSGVYSSWKPLTDAPNVAGLTNLYRVGDLEAREQDVQLASASAGPISPTDIIYQNRFAGASSDSRHVIFQSAWNLTGDGSVISGDGNLYEYADGVGTRAVGRIPAGSDSECDDVAGPACVNASSAQPGVQVYPTLGTSQYGAGMISEDGSRVLFQAPAVVGPGSIYLREDGRRTYQIDGSGSGRAWAMSDDGSRVFLTTEASLVGGDSDGGVPDLYMFDVTAPAGSRLSLLSEGRAVGGLDPVLDSVVGTSVDGHYVYFVSGGQLVAGEETPVDYGLYVWHDGQIRYVGTFGDALLAKRNTPRTGWELATGTRTSRVSRDGRHLLFMSYTDTFRGRGGYGGYDHGSSCNYGGNPTCRELFVYSADTGRLACASCSPLTRVATGDALTDVFAGGSAGLNTQHLSHALSDDGRRVFFSSPMALVAEDANGRWDAYEYDVASGTPHLISTGKSAADSYFMDASADGRDVFFTTREQLVGWDVDDNYDLYDARVGGGFPEPPPPGQPCVGDACRAASTLAPAAGAGASAAFRGAGDSAGRLRAHRRCKGRAVLKRVRGKRKCVQPRRARRGRRHATRARVRNERSGR